MRFCPLPQKSLQTAAVLWTKSSSLCLVTDAVVQVSQLRHGWSAVTGHV
eukprot:CAMPEP_0196717696 /NCGR_PEP_ID=MMETSP1091-20130531/1066_1 /TAXON_ID=302021 /ORGANISM="Rhodomonas sp., Strain CCMP768" /LENGTH=48 /DNA_ID= /DNA_START= /DNA_END= /DNA_ORIENTATION=